jgi:predicted DNA-binding transcriptional regulator AlpA
MAEVGGMEFLSIQEVCDRYKIAERTLYRMIARGDFPKPVKMGGNKWSLSKLKVWESSV